MEHLMIFTTNTLINCEEETISTTTKNVSMNNHKEWTDTFFMIMFILIGTVLVISVLHVMFSA